MQVSCPPFCDRGCLVLSGRHTSAREGQFVKATCARHSRSSTVQVSRLLNDLGGCNGLEITDRI
ncbi:hypothetical protein E2C01_057111 [Portunus trituberculatus]|uniref:Uncharacterized protein n=1 Tax=Portunus trituberculatus TaxID=210409 RepID=A0A5B7GZI0_PORTR|nr:hypothetical protein [Portunus trituberculatus]